jgi:peptide/nickel transport system permease protein
MEFFLRARGALSGRVAMIVSSAYLLLLTVATLAAPAIAPADPSVQDLANAFTGPSSQHLLGGDQLGRDVLSRLIYGAGPALLFSGIATVVGTLIGVTAGLIAGYRRGWFERTTDQASNIVMAIPGLILLLVVVTVFPQNTVAGAVAFGVLAAPHLFRVVRSVVLSVRNELHVDAARVAGLSARSIIFGDIAPRVNGPIIVQMTLAASSALLAATGLAFLGFGADPSHPSWGGMIGEAATYISQYPILVVPAGAMTFITSLALGILGDSIRDATNDRMPVVTPVCEVAKAPVQHAAIRVEPRSRALLSVVGRRVTMATPGGPVDLVEDLTLAVESGKVVGLVGESGSGKTLSARSLAGLLPAGMKADGTAWTFDGISLVNCSAKEIARLRGKRISLVAQEPLSALDPTCSVEKLLISLIKRHNPSEADPRRRMLELLAEVKLPHPEQTAKKFPYELSGGMALVGEPQLLIADEPTSALDVTVQAGILNLLRSLKETRGLSILLVTHDWGVVADLCDSVVVMYAGQVVESGTVHQVFHKPQHPYTAALLAANPAAAAPKGKLPVIPGAVPDPRERPHGCYFAPRCAFAQDECRKAPVEYVESLGGAEVRCMRHLDLSLPGVSDRENVIGSDLESAGPRPPLG